MVNNIKDTVKLANGVDMPRFGLGVWQVTDEDTLLKAFDAAMRAGYPMVDTATAYGNEDMVGKAISQMSGKREDLFVTTKLWNPHQGYQETLDAFERSMSALQLDYLDLYLIHWPQPWEGKFVDTYRAFLKLYEEKRIRAIGVCNFKPHHIEELYNKLGVYPMVNQVECHPLNQQLETKAYCKEHGIQLEAYSPLLHGEIGQVKEPLDKIAAKYGKTAAQVCIRWQIDSDVIVIPKSVHENRIFENADVFDFCLDETDMAEIAKLNKDFRFLPDPDVQRRPRRPQN